MLGALLVATLPAVSAAGVVPYPDALAAASVTEENIADISRWWSATAS